MNGEGRVLCTCTFMYPKGASTGTGTGEGRDGRAGMGSHSITRPAWERDFCVACFVLFFFKRWDGSNGSVV